MSRDPSHPGLGQQRSLTGLENSVLPTGWCNEQYLRGDMRVLPVVELGMDAAAGPSTLSLMQTRDCPLVAGAASPGSRNTSAAMEMGKGGCNGKTACHLHPTPILSHSSAIIYLKSWLGTVKSQHPQQSEGRCPWAGGCSGEELLGRLPSQSPAKEEEEWRWA